MSAFDAQISIAALRVAVPENLEDQIPHLNLLMTMGLALPFTQGDNEPLIVPLGRLTGAIDKQLALSTGQALLQEGEKLPELGDIETASDLEGVEKVARHLESLKGKPNG